MQWLLGEEGKMGWYVHQVLVAIVMVMELMSKLWEKWSRLPLMRLEKFRVMWMKIVELVCGVNKI